MARLLLVEDDALIRLMIRNMLTRQGFEIVEAENGAHALGILLHDSGFSAVITDVFMPLVNGLDLTREVKLLFPTLPVIVISAFPGSQQEALDRGASGYLPKPFAVKDLMNTLNQVISPAG